MWWNRTPLKRFLSAFKLSPWPWSSTTTIGESHLRILYQNHSKLRIIEEDFREEIIKHLTLTNEGVVINDKHKIVTKQTSYDLPEGWDDSIEIK